MRAVAKERRIPIIAKKNFVRPANCRAVLPDFAQIGVGFIYRSIMLFEQISRETMQKQ
jgi:hypothetical protein